MTGAGERSQARLRAAGFDPGLSDTGYAVLESGDSLPAVVGSGVIRTQAGDLLEARLEVLFEGVQEVLARFGPDVVVVEDVFSTPAIPRAAILMGHARAVICLAGRLRKLPLLSVTPAEVKRAVTLSGVAPKGQVARAVQARLGLGRPPSPSHVADALALALTGLSRVRGPGRNGWWPGVPRR